MSNASQINSHIQILILPSPEEDDDMETLSLVDDVRQGFLDEVSQLSTLTIEVGETQTRDAGLIVLITKIAHGIVTQKDLIAQFFQTSKFAIDALSARGHVKTIEMTIDGNSIHIDDASYAQVDRLIDIFESKYPGKAQEITPLSTVEVMGTISKIKQAALAEKPISKVE